MPGERDARHLFQHRMNRRPVELAQIQDVHLCRVFAARADISREIRREEAFGVVMEKGVPDVVDRIVTVDHILPDGDGGGEAHRADAREELCGGFERDAPLFDGAAGFEIEDRSAVRRDAPADDAALAQRRRNAEQIAPRRDRDGHARVGGFLQRREDGRAQDVLMVKTGAVQIDGEQLHHKAEPPSEPR